MHMNEGGVSLQAELGDEDDEGVVDAMYEAVKESRQAREESRQQREENEEVCEAEESLLVAPIDGIKLAVNVILESSPLGRYLGGLQNAADPPLHVESDTVPPTDSSVCNETSLIKVGGILVVKLVKLFPLASLLLALDHPAEPVVARFVRDLNGVDGRGGHPGSMDVVLPGRSLEGSEVGEIGEYATSSTAFSVIVAAVCVLACLQLVVVSTRFGIIEATVPLFVLLLAVANLWFSVLRVQFERRWLSCGHQLLCLRRETGRLRKAFARAVRCIKEVIII
jgi:hypothetical protein